MKNKPHLLLLTHSYAPDDAVPARRWKALVRRLMETGFHVSVVAPAPHVEIRSWSTTTGSSGEDIYWIPGAQRARTRWGRLANNAVSSLAMVPRGLAVKDLDVVLGTVPALTTAVSAYLCAYLRKRPLILEMRDAWPDLARDAGLARTPLRSTMEFVLRRIQEKASAVVTVTNGFAEVLRARGCSHVLSIPNGLPEDIAPVSTHPGHLRSGRLEVLYMGNHGESQGLEYLIRAAAVQPDDVHLTLVGQGTQKQALQALARSLGAPVTFLDPVPSGEVEEHYDRCDTCVVSLRPDWDSFDYTIPSKTYELLMVGRKLTAMLKGEAAALVEQRQPGSVVTADPEAIADYWRSLHADPEKLVVSANDTENRPFGFEGKAARYARLVKSLLPSRKEKVRG